MDQAFVSTFRDQMTSDVFQIRFEWVKGRVCLIRWNPAQKRLEWFRREPGHYRLFLESLPPCRYPLGMSAHLLARNQICVLAGREPRTKERAKAIAMHWLRGFGCYRRTGQFPNDARRVNVIEQQPVADASPTNG